MTRIPFAVLLLLSLGSCAGPGTKPAPPQPQPVQPRESAAKAPPAPERPVTPPPPLPVPPTPPQPTAAGPAPKPATPGLKELFPHVRADLAARLIEFDGTVPIDAHDPRTPVVYLEVTVCTPDTKEHEALVVTPALPSHIHAALLAAGYQTGSPGSWKWENKKLSSVPPTGDALDISIAYKDADGKEIETPAIGWIRNAASNGPKFGATPGSHFVFAGSALVKRQGREVYDADGSGLLIGLTTFGSETIAWSEVISHEAEIAEPEWIADGRVVPKAGTPVVVRIRPGR